ncbi:hypothetical protein [Actinomadura litoris]|uniref:hypothetical protein n=1 Tax=Actinomadura litoris TaxID=2678616 RepID=UPI001FA6D6EE|nr:hypothetical protein [Actinomadura litoris]
MYARGATPLDEATSIAKCVQWATAHDWDVVEEIRESSDAEAPLARAGYVKALAMIQGGGAEVLMAVSRLELAEDHTDYQGVCSRVEKLGGFVHTLDAQKEPRDAS